MPSLSAGTSSLGVRGPHCYRVREGGAEGEKEQREAGACAGRSPLLAVSCRTEAGGAGPGGSGLSGTEPPPPPETTGSDCWATG